MFLIQDKGGVVILLYDCYVMLFFIIYLGLVKVYYFGFVVEVKVQLEVFVYNLERKSNVEIKRND